MSITGNYFKFDNISSKQYNLMMVNIKTSSENTIVDGRKEYADINLCNGTFTSLGRKVKEPLSFDMEICVGAENTEINEITHRNIVKWLFDRINYHKLEIFSKEYSDVYFNCRLTNAEKIVVGIGVVGYKFTVTCNSAWAWEKENNALYTIPSTPCTVNFINSSDDEEIMYPKKTIITCGAVGGSISVRNVNNPNSLMQFTGLSANEEITIDEFGQLESSLSISRYNNWNGVRLGFINQINKLMITGNVSKLNIVYQNARRVGY